MNTGSGAAAEIGAALTTYSHSSLVGRAHGTTATDWHRLPRPDWLAQWPIRLIGAIAHVEAA